MTANAHPCGNSPLLGRQATYLMGGKLKDGTVITPKGNQRLMEIAVSTLATGPWGFFCWACPEPPRAGSASTSLPPSAAIQP